MLVIENLDKLKITKVRNYSINFTYDNKRYYLHGDYATIRSNDDKNFGITKCRYFYVNDYIKYIHKKRRCLCDVDKEYFVKQLLMIGLVFNEQFDKEYKIIQHQHSELSKQIQELVNKKNIIMDNWLKKG